MEQAERKQQLFSIQAGRGIAAVLVVFHHASSIASEDRFFGRDAFDGLFKGFNVGVDYFFVLSGFIIAWIHWKDLGRPGRLGYYAERRFLRIYPPYWGILFPLMALYLLVPSAGKSYQHDHLNYLFSPLLLPYPLQPILGVAWTLVFEVIFYCVFGAIIVAGWPVVWALPVWAGAILVAQSTTQLSFPFNIFLSAHILEFLMGLIAAVYLQRRSLPLPWFWAVVGTACFFAALPFSAEIQASQLAGRLVFGLCSVAALAGFVEWERQGGISVPRWMRSLGDGSYAIYLVHAVAISFLIQALFKIGAGRLPLPAMIGILVAAGVTAGMLYHLLAERRLINFFRRLLPRVDRTTAAKASRSPL